MLSLRRQPQAQYAVLPHTQTASAGGGSGDRLGAAAAAAAAGKRAWRTSCKLALATVALVCALGAVAALYESRRQPAWLQPCASFAHVASAGACRARFVEETCVPRASQVWLARPPASDGCEAVGPARVCGSDVALLVMTSRLTAGRMAATAATWLPAARAAGFSLLIVVASQEGAHELRAAVPDIDALAPVAVLGMEEFTTHGGFAHVHGALNVLAARYPRARWYAKMDDDAFLYPTNLLYNLANAGANASETVAFGNTLVPNTQFVSGGAGYVISAPALVAMLSSTHPDCFGASHPPDTNEDIVVSACLRTLPGARFVHNSGFHMSPPDQAYGPWQVHHWGGPPRYPVSFHWLKAGHTKTCLACGCVEAVEPPRT